MIVPEQFITGAWYCPQFANAYVDQISPCVGNILAVQEQEYYKYHGGENVGFWPRLFDNGPLSGFSQVSARAYSQGKHDARADWNILDPRGFETAISLENMFWLLTYSTVDRGEFVTPCVWAWHPNSSQQVLLSVNDPEYLSARKTIE
jgi:hypothetical protein